MEYVHYSVEVALTAAVLWFWYRAGKFRQEATVKAERLERARVDLSVWTTIAESRAKTIEKLQAAAKVRYQAEAKKVETDAKKLTGADLAAGLADAVNSEVESTPAPAAPSSPKVMGFRK